MKVKLSFFIPCFVICFLFSNTNAQNSLVFNTESVQLNTEDDSSSENVQPSFPGGETKLNDYIAKNLRYPVAARENKTQGIVYVSFIVETDGSLSNILVTKDIGNGCGEAASNLIKGMPKWKPGKRNDKVARMGVNLPIKFVLEK